MAVHAGVATAESVFGHGVGGDGQDRRGRHGRGQGADLAGGAQAVQMRHPHVHQDQVEHALSRTLNGFQPIRRLNRLAVGGGQHQPHHLTVHRVIVDDQHSHGPIGLGRDRFRRHGQSLQRNEQREGRPLALDAAHLDPPAQTPRLGLGQGQADARAHVRTLQGIVALGEGVEQVWQEIGVDAAAGIGNGDAQHRAVIFSGDKNSAPIREFYGVGDQMMQGLAKPATVAAKLPLCAGAHNEGHRQPLGLGVDQRRGRRLVQQFRNVQSFRNDVVAPARELQNVLDQHQHGLARAADGLDLSLRLRRQIATA